MNLIIKPALRIYLFLIILISVFACHKEGIGGKSSISGKVMHHSMQIPNAVVYIKYGATDFPGANLSLYDDHSTSNANANFEINNLRKGDYYLYGVGYDNSILEQVSGGISVKLKYNKSTTTDVPVTE